MNFKHKHSICKVISIVFSRFMQRQLMISVAVA